MRRYVLIPIGVVLLVGVWLSGGHTQAQCEGEPATDDDDTIVCNGANPPDEIVTGNDGNDTIIIEGDSPTGFVPDVSGDNIEVDGTGDDTIINDGTTNDVTGDTFFGVGTGNDSITNNGTVEGAIYGDTIAGEASGNDSITNNGTVEGDIYGDVLEGDGAGDDTITNNGTVEGNINGNGGNDDITNTGTVNGGIDAGAGDDTVTLVEQAPVGGTVNGGDGTDSLEFDITSGNEDELTQWAQQIAAANPSGGTLTFGGVTYTWTNFEELVELLRLQSLNTVTAPMQGFCRSSGNFDVYRIINSEEGELAFSVTPEEVALALLDIEENTLLTGDGDLQLWALASGELQMNGPDGYEFRFFYEATCGLLPEVEPIEPVVVVEEEDEDVLEFVIINRPAN